MGYYLRDKDQLHLFQDQQWFSRPSHSRLSSGYQCVLGELGGGGLRFILMLLRWLWRGDESERVPQAYDHPCTGTRWKSRHEQHDEQREPKPGMGR